MSTPERREPTNEELWAQPPTSAQPTPGPQGLAPLPQAPLPAPLPQLPPPPAFHQQRPDRTPLTLAIASMGLGVPLTAISADQAGLPGMLVVWTGIVLVNWVYGRYRRP
ncbi:MAG: hypothetical protein IPL43_00790 [Micropruina sp.]|nr:hypothetical protein [Micropruina sp.]